MIQVYPFGKNEIIVLWKDRIIFDNSGRDYTVKELREKFAPMYYEKGYYKNLDDFFEKEHPEYLL